MTYVLIEDLALVDSRGDEDDKAKVEDIVIAES